MEKNDLVKLYNLIEPRLNLSDFLKVSGDQAGSGRNEPNYVLRGMI